MAALFREISGQAGLEASNSRTFCRSHEFSQLIIDVPVSAPSLTPPGCGAAGDERSRETESKLGQLSILD